MRQYDSHLDCRAAVTVLKAEFRMSEDQALRVMMTAHRRGACVVAVYTKDVAEAKATNGTDAGRARAIRCCSRPSLRSNPAWRTDRQLNHVVSESHSGSPSSVTTASRGQRFGQRQPEHNLDHSQEMVMACSLRNL
jgi:hypothetical protein